MKPLYLFNDVILSPLGFSTSENLQAIRSGRSALEIQQEIAHNAGPTGIISDQQLRENFSRLGDADSYTKLEQMLLLAVNQVLEQYPHLDLTETALILSTTKGNIDLLKNRKKFPEKRLYLSELGNIIARFFGFTQKPVVLSNACISGGLALAVARRLITSGKFKNAVVAGGDLVSDFVLAGFESLQAVSGKPCRPFSQDRDGISLGEAAAAILVSGQASDSSDISLIADTSTNDANHISGPSRTGEGLFRSIKAALKEAGITAAEIGFLSAHGTATPYNDEMEAIAFNRAGLGRVPVNSFKGYYGHTLGASALLETILTKHTLQNQELYVSHNFSEMGVSQPINIITRPQKKKMQYGMKTASGFGGCNLALVLQKNNFKD